VVTIAQIYKRIELFIEVFPIFSLQNTNYGKMKFTKKGLKIKNAQIRRFEALCLFFWGGFYRAKTLV
jgi:hypothetical protein